MRYDLSMNLFPSFRAILAISIGALALTACYERSASQAVVIQPNGILDSAVSCEPPPVAVNVGVLLDSAWGRNGVGAFPFTKGGPEPAPGNVELRLSLNFTVKNDIPKLVSVTGRTPAGDTIFLPAIVHRSVTYSPPLGGYTETPAQYQASGCDSIWNKSDHVPGGWATQNPDGSYKAQCASFMMDAIPVIFTQAGGQFSSNLNNPALVSFVDNGKVGWFDPNTGKVMVGTQAYSLVSRGWELAARLQEIGTATFTTSQVPWGNGVVGRVSSDLVKSQIAKFGATESTSGSDYTYRTDAFSQAGKWVQSRGHYAVGVPKSGPGRLSAGVAMFRLEGSISQDKKTLSVSNFSYSGPMLVCPADGQECTASPGRNFTGLTCSSSI